MDLIDGMRTFVAAVETGSFTGAGARLGISNKLASKYIAALEQRLGAALLYRTTRALSLTEQGEAYIAACRKALAALDDADASIAAPAAGLAGRLRLAAPVTFGEVFVTGALADFLTLNPALQIELMLSDATSDLAADGLDVAIRIGNLPDSGLIAHKLGETRLVTLASPDYLNDQGEPRHPAGLSNHDCILDTNAATPARWTFTVDGARVAIPVSGRLSVNSASAAIQLALAGHGLIRCPELFAANALQSGALVPVLAAFPGPVLDIQTVHLPTTFRQPKIAALSDFLRQRLRSISACGTPSQPAVAG